MQIDSNTVLVSLSCGIPINQLRKSGLGETSMNTKIVKNFTTVFVINPQSLNLAGKIN